MMTRSTNTISRPLTVNGFGALRCVLEDARRAEGCSLGDLTVLSAQVDPYRLDTPAGHRDGKWISDQIDRVLRRGQKIHWRGLHYLLVTVAPIKPNGEQYTNTNENWHWLIDVAGKAARWLGYVPFELIVDNRNAPAVIHRKARVRPRALVSVGIDVTIPSADDLNPVPIVHGFEPWQPYAFAVFGEKASLEEVVLPIARAQQADLYLGTGETSDTLLYQIAKDASEDGRPLVVFTLTDCDPAGHQMAVSIGRKLQALRDLLFPNLKFEVVPVALTVEQVQEFGLPSTPLKESERRADRWRAAFGVEQTEIDALATLRPDLLREIVERAFNPYFDRTLEDRVRAAKNEWLQQAQAAIDSQVDAAVLAALREEAAGRLAELESVVEDLNERLRLAADRFRLPMIRVPAADIDEGAAS